MDLWIRSQDKERLIKVAYLEFEKDDYGFYILGREDKFSGNRLGEYKTKERALEVLDEIQTIIKGKYATSFDYKIALKGFRTEEVNKMLEMMAVYEMPKE